jgi:hypothetical protein
MSSSPSKNSAERRGLIYGLFWSFGFLVAWFLSATSQNRGPSARSDRDPLPERVPSQSSSAVFAIPRPSVQASNSQEHDNTPPRKKWRDILGTLSTIVLLVANIILALATMKQVSLLGEQLETTQAAIVNITRISTDDVQPDGKSRTLTVAFKNAGKGIAHYVRISLKISYKDLPGKLAISSEPGVSWEIPVGELKPSPENEPNDSMEIKVISIDHERALQIDSVQQTMFVEGEVLFDNGFRKIRQPVCWALVSTPPNTLASRGANFQQCNAADAAWEYWFRLHKYRTQ